MHSAIAHEERLQRRWQPQFGTLPWISKLLGVVSLIVGVLGANDSVRAAAAMRWPSVPGVIEGNEVRYDTVSWSGRVPSPMRANRFYVAYTYSVDSRAQTGNRIDVFMPVGKNYPREYQARYPKGKSPDGPAGYSDQRLSRDALSQSPRNRPWAIEE